MSVSGTAPSRLLTALGADGTAPRLTWYGSAGGERVELSGRVLTNWITKAANLLAEEADAAPGSVVVIHLPVHWRAAVWTLATWLTGATAGLDEQPEAADVVVTSDPTAAPAADLTLAVALPALAMAWDGADLPAGAMDAAAELGGYGDTLGFVQAPDPDDEALSGVRYADLETWAAPAAAAGSRVLLSPGNLEDLMRQAFGVWLAGGSVVLAAPDAPGLDRVVEAEGVTVRLDAPD